MSDSLIMPRPTNLRLGEARLKFVESDVYNICERIKEIDPNLSVSLHEGAPQPWVVIEHCADGQDRFVARYSELDQRILENLRYMLAVPFEKRMEILDRQVNEENSKQGQMTEDQFDRFARDFFDAGTKSGIINANWTKNYPLSARQMKKKPKETGA